MNNNETQQLINQLLSGDGKIAIDNHDIDTVTQNAATLDGGVLRCAADQFQQQLGPFVQGILNHHPGEKCTHMVLSIKMGYDSTLKMQQFEALTAVFASLDDDVEVTWGVALKPDLASDEVQVPVLMGFNAQ